VILQDGVLRCHRRRTWVLVLGFAAEYGDWAASRSAESRAFWQTLPMPDERGQQPGAEAAPASLPRAENPPSDTRSHPEGSPLQSREIGGPKGPEPTRFGDWERAGRCIDF
jgi:hypothetical protein